jgi:outer membrane protein assembly factor BamB
MLRRSRVLVAGVSAMMLATVGVAPAVAGTLSPRATVWAADIEAGPVSAPTIGKNSVYAGTAGGTVTAVDPATGQIIWRTALTGVYGPLGAATTPTLGKNLLFTGTSGGHLVALKPDTGALAWVTDIEAGAVSAPTIGKNSVYAGTADGTVTAVDPATGQIIRRTQVADASGALGAATTPTLGKNLLYTGTSSGHLAALG